MPAARFRRPQHRLLVLAFVLLVAALPAAAPATASSPIEGRWVRVQLDGRITPADRAAIGETGLAAIQYVHENAYVAFAGSAAVELAARAVAGVTEVRGVAAAEKLHDGMRALEGLILADVVVFGRAAYGAATRLAMLGDLVDRFGFGADRTMTSLIVRLPAATLGQVTSDPAVLWVGPAATGPYPEDEASSQI
ncbi:MAG: hypothetical protein ACRDH9_02765, partial [Actinomycetota bacterium]